MINSWRNVLLVTTTVIASFSSQHAWAEEPWGLSLSELGWMLENDRISQGNLESLLTECLGDEDCTIYPVAPPRDTNDVTVLKAPKITSFEIAAMRSAATKEDDCKIPGDRIVTGAKKPAVIKRSPSQPVKR